jgi:hypothetical protein
VLSGNFGQSYQWGTANGLGDIVKDAALGTDCVGSALFGHVGDPITFVITLAQSA